ncbi:MAG: hypothetical protein KDJ65_26755 [Anaerolineae bacterium]|nr:hypothetical protein [Anaerolineae bacterium]
MTPYKPMLRPSVQQNQRLANAGLGIMKLHIVKGDEPALNPGEFRQGGFIFSPRPSPRNAPTAAGE